LAFRLDLDPAAERAYRHGSNIDLATQTISKCALAFVDFVDFMHDGAAFPELETVFAWRNLGALRDLRMPLGHAAGLGYLLPDGVGRSVDQHRLICLAWRGAMRQRGN